MGEFLKGSINFRKKTSFYYDIVTNETAGNTFAAVTHYRTTTFGGENTSSYTAIATFGCGVAHSKPSAALQLQNYGSSTITARLDVYASEGEAMICLRGNRDSSYSNELELGKNIWFSEEMNAKKFNASSVEEIKENIRDVDEQHINTDRKRKVVETCVKAVEQLYRDLDGVEKLEKAKENIFAMLTQDGIEITELYYEKASQETIKAMEPI